MPQQLAISSLSETAVLWPLVTTVVGYCGVMGAKTNGRFPNNALAITPLQHQTILAAGQKAAVDFLIEVQKRRKTHPFHIAVSSGRLDPQLPESKDYPWVAIPIRFPVMS